MHVNIHHHSLHPFSFIIPSQITATSLRKTSFSNKPVPQLGMGMGVPQHPVYRPNGPNNLAGVGIGGMMDNRGHQGNRHGMNPPPFSSYTQQGQAQMQQQQQQHGNSQYTYTAKILSNLHADARDRESASGVRTHAIQSSVYSGAGQMSLDRKPSLDRHHSGGSNPGAGAYGGFADVQNGGTYGSSANSVGSGGNEGYDDVLTGYHQQGPPADPYHQRSPQQYHDSAGDSLRMRVPSYSYPSPPNTGRAGPPGQGQGPQGYGQQQQQQQRDHLGFAPQREFHNPQHQGQGGNGRADFGFEQGQRHAPSALYNPSQNVQGGVVRDRDYPPSPGASSVGYGIDNSYFESSAAPLNDSFSQSGPGSRPSSIRSSFGSSGLPARFDDPLDTPLFQNLQSVGGAGGVGGGARSLLSGLREGTVELLSGGGADREWDQNSFQHSQNGSPDWRGGGGGKY